MPHVLAVAAVQLDDATTRRTSFVLTGRPLRIASPGDGAWGAMAAAMAEGRTIAGLRSDEDPVAAPTAALVCRPASAMVGGAWALGERSLGADQSNTSVVLGEAVLLKAFRRLQPGLNPELELGAYLSEEAGFAAWWPRWPGSRSRSPPRHGTETVAVAQAFIHDGADAYESIAEGLAAWILAPGEVSVEFATEVAADLGTLTAGLHAALASARGVPDLEPRDASRAELRAWSRAARRGLAGAMDVVSGEAASVLRDRSPQIAEAFEAFEASATLPLLTRIQADYHLGQVLIAPDGYRIVDFEGDPLRRSRSDGRSIRPFATWRRRRVRSTMSGVRRDVARWRRTRRARSVARAGPAGVWLLRSRERFLAAYRAGIREGASSDRA